MRTWSKFETSNPDKLFFAQNQSLSCSVWISKSQNLWLQTPLVWGPWKNGKFGLKIAVQHETRRGKNS
jgi:hypothetical protein